MDAGDKGAAEIRESLGQSRRSACPDTTCCTPNGCGQLRLRPIGFIEVTIGPVHVSRSNPSIGRPLGVLMKRTSCQRGPAPSSKRAPVNGHRHVRRSVVQRTSKGLYLHVLKDAPSPYRNALVRALSHEPKNFRA